MRARLVVIVLFVACAPGGSGGSMGDITSDSSDATAHETTLAGTFRGECEVACNPDFCAEDPTCVDACVAMTDGLETLCGKCLASNILLTRADDGTCALRGFGISGCSALCDPEATTPRAEFRAECETWCAASAAAEGCPGDDTCVADCVATTAGLDALCGKCVVQSTYVFPASDSEFSCLVVNGGFGCGDDVCEAGTHQPRADFRAECEVTCRNQAAMNGCDVPASCVDDCTTVTRGLETQCGKCVASTTTLQLIGPDECGATPGSVADERCDCAR